MMHNKCVSCSRTVHHHRLQTGPDGYKTLCNPCYVFYRDQRLPLYVSPSGVSARASSGASTVRHEGFELSQLFPRKQDMRRPIVRDVSVDGDLIRQPSDHPSQSKHIAACIACGNVNSQLAVGPDGPETLCATCNKRLRLHKIRLWRASDGRVTAKPSRSLERVIAVGFDSRVDSHRRTLARPRVRRATAAEHARLPAHRPKKILRITRLRKEVTTERSEEPGWEPNSSEADREQEEDEEEDDDDDDGDGEGTKERNENEEDEDGEEELEEEQLVHIEKREEVRQLELRGRRIPIRHVLSASATTSSPPRRSSRIRSEKTAEPVSLVLMQDVDRDELDGQEEPAVVRQISKRLRVSPELRVLGSQSGSGVNVQESAQPSTSPSAPSRPTSLPVERAPAARTLLKMGPAVDALRARGLSFGVKASCSYGWMTRRRYVCVAYGLRFGSFKQVLGETFDMDGVPFTVCYVDDEGDEIIISDDSDMRPMFDLAKGKESALRVRLRPP